MIVTAVLTAALAADMTGAAFSRSTGLVIEYIGPMDTPVSPIVVSNSKERAATLRATLLPEIYDTTPVHSVSRVLLAKLMSVASEYGAVSEADGLNPIFRLRLARPERVSTFLIEQRRGERFVEDLTRLCPVNSELRNAFLIFKHEIGESIHAPATSK